MVVWTGDMYLLVRKKKYPFQVELVIEELTAVPFVRAVLFCKVHLLSGGKFVGHSSCEEVSNHTVKWNARMMFLAKMCAPINTGVLEPCICRISVRKEAKGGRSFQKLGFAEANLAEMVGQRVSRRYLLEGYSSRRRQDNSMLKVTVHITMLSGDPCFRTPNVEGLASLARESSETGNSNVPGHSSATSSASAASSVSASAASRPPSDSTPALLAAADDAAAEVSRDSAVSNKDDNPPDGAADAVSISVAINEAGSAGVQTNAAGGAMCADSGHSRNSSSQSGYGSLNSRTQSQHSRQSSDGDTGTARNAGSGSGFSDYNSMERVQARCRDLIGSRFEATRVDPEAMVNDLLLQTDLNADLSETTESSGLQLYVGRDGTTAFFSQDAGGHLEPVVICKR